MRPIGAVDSTSPPVTEITDFGLIVLAVSGTVFVALLGMRGADRFSVPYAALFLVATVVLTETFSSLDEIASIRKVERLTVVALVVILFDGGLHIGLGASGGPQSRFSHWASWEP